MRRAAAALVKILVTAAALELGTRAVVSVREHDTDPLRYGFRVTAGTGSLPWAPPGAAATGKYLPGMYPAQYGVRRFSISINQHGLRGPEFAARKPEGVYRVILVGESSTFGTESPEDETISACLQRRLTQVRGGRVEVLNAGMPGAFSDALARRVKTDLLGYAPDVLVTYMGYTDIDRLLYYDDALYNLGPGSLRRASLFYHSLLTYGSMWRARTAYWNREGVDRFLERYRRSIEDIVDAAKATRTSVVLVTQPIHLSRVDAHTRAERLTAIGEAVAQRKPLSPAEMVLYLHRLEIDALAEIAARGHVRIVDAAARFDARDTSLLFQDIVHLTASGNEAIAEAMLDGILALESRP